MANDDIVKVGVLTLRDRGPYYSVIDCDEDAVDVAIPREYEGKTVGSIYERAFLDCVYLRNIDIPDSITNIGDNAFENCAQLAAITLPKSVESISSAAFKNCTSLSSVYITDSVKWLEGSVFSGCSSLRRLTVPYIGISITPRVLDRPGELWLPDAVTFGHLFGKEEYPGSVAVEQRYRGAHSWNGDEFVTYYIPSSLRSVTVLHGDIPYSAFCGCSMLSTVIMPSDTKIIDEYAFYDCTSLRSITIPETVKSIGNDAFGGCDRVVEVINHSGVDEEEYSTSFGGMCGRALVVHRGINAADAQKDAEEENVNESRIVNIGDFLFITDDSGKNHLLDYVGTDATVTLPENYRGESYVIADYAFYERDDIVEVTIPSAVGAIGEFAFAECTFLEKILFYAENMSDLEYGNHVFTNAGKNGTGVKVTIGRGVKKLPKYLFYPNKDDSGTPRIRELVFEDVSSCESIGDNAFFECVELTRVDIPDSVTEIGREAFAGCTALSELSLGIGVESIGDLAFDRCESLAKLPLPQSIRNIGNTAFSGCRSLKEVVIPDGTLSIGGFAFNCCDNLCTVDIPESVEKIGEGAFHNCNAIVRINVSVKKPPKGWHKKWMDKKRCVAWKKK